MSDIDRQRVTAVRTLQMMGYLFRDGDWVAPAANGNTSEADRLHALLVMRADQLAGCTEGSREADELGAIAEALEAYEAIRWPDGKVPGGEG
jgi:hypothetical protein